MAADVIILTSSVRYCPTGIFFVLQFVRLTATTWSITEYQSMVVNVLLSYLLIGKSLTWAYNPIKLCRNTNNYNHSLRKKNPHTHTRTCITHTRARAHTHSHMWTRTHKENTHARTHARTYTHLHTRARTHTCMHRQTIVLAHVSSERYLSKRKTIMRRVDSTRHDTTGCGLEEEDSHHIRTRSRRRMQYPK